MKNISFLKISLLSLTGIVSVKGMKIDKESNKQEIKTIKERVDNRVEILTKSYQNILRINGYLNDRKSEIYNMKYASDFINETFEEINKNLQEKISKFRSFLRNEIKILNDKKYQITLKEFDDIISKSKLGELTSFIENYELNEKTIIEDMIKEYKENLVIFKEIYEEDTKVKEKIAQKQKQEIDSITFLLEENYLTLWEIINDISNKNEMISKIIFHKDEVIVDIQKRLSNINIKSYDLMRVLSEAKNPLQTAKDLSVVTEVCDKIYPKLQEIEQFAQDYNMIKFTMDKRIAEYKIKTQLNNKFAFDNTSYKAQTIEEKEELNDRINLIQSFVEILQGIDADLMIKKKEINQDHETIANKTKIVILNVKCRELKTSLNEEQEQLSSFGVYKGASKLAETQLFVYHNYPVYDGYLDEKQ